jgi:sodium/bile acid cotransporter 7
MSRFLSLLSRAGLNGFFFLMIAMVILAWLFPEAGAENNPFHLKTISNIGVGVIFFFYGLKLNWTSLKSGLGHWKLHLIIQMTTFLLFPLLILILHTMFSTSEYSYWWIGAFYLAALPSTVSSSVVMVSIAGGNISAAIFNASISSLIGIFITPLWMSLLVDNSSLSIADLSGVILNLCLQVLFPVIAGLLLHNVMGRFVERNKDRLRYFDQAVILLIVFRAFAESFLRDMFTGYTTLELITLSALMFLLFVVLVAIMQLVSSWMKFSREDRITIIFCGSKKSLVQGAVMGQVLFPQASAFGIILLPLMVYHALQLVAGSILAQQMVVKKNHS